MRKELLDFEMDPIGMFFLTFVSSVKDSFFNSTWNVKLWNINFQL